jgi:hypothetical protein
MIKSIGEESHTGVEHDSLSPYIMNGEAAFISQKVGAQRMLQVGPSAI